MGDDLAFLAGGGVAACMIRERDWSGHPLGSPRTWPKELRTALSLVLNSPELSNGIGTGPLIGVQLGPLVARSATPLLSPAKRVGVAQPG
ncbi:hypothetical protein PUR29_29925 [Methylobacterium ajmalii]|uniref:Uncharacterized protein n=1 Tax=Methylobacterium ajmalii TaxID=2738439 RepID=A0ABV0A324_9HYPH